MPALFESSRQWLSVELKIDPKEITMIGSGRIGFSMAPKTYGKPYSDKSDLDMSIVSKDLFNRLQIDYEQWIIDYDRGLKCAYSKYGEFNRTHLPNIIKKGFIDHYKIPFNKAYPEVLHLEDRLNALKLNLELVDGMPLFSKVSVRVYSDWRAFVRQMKVNLASTKGRFVEKTSEKLVAPTSEN